MKPHSLDVISAQIVLRPQVLLRPQALLRPQVLLRPMLFLLLLLAACQGPTLPSATVGPGPQPAPTLMPTKTPVAADPTATLPPAAPSPTPLPSLDRPIVWYLRGETPADLPRVNERLNRELALRGFNATVEMRVVARAAYGRKIEESEAAGEPFDLFTLTAGRYAAELENQGLLPLSAYPNPQTGRDENLLETAAPRLWAALPPAGWAAVQRDGNISAVPVPSGWVRPRGVSIRADVVQALDLQAELKAARVYADLTPVFEKIQTAIQDGALKERAIADAENARQVFAQADLLHPETAGYDPLALPFVIRYDDPQMQALNWYQSADFKKLAALRRDWQLAGFAPELSLSPEEIVTGYQSGKYLVMVGPLPVGPSSAGGQSARFGHAWLDWPISPTFVPSAAPFNTLVGVNARIGDDPLRVRRVLLLIEYLFTDPGISNLLVYGIEGEHWTWTDPAQHIIRRLPGGRYQPDFTDQLGGLGLAYTLQDGQQESWAAVGRRNLQAPASAAMGFLFDPRPVAGEMAALQGLTLEWLAPLADGQVRDIDAYLNRMHKALSGAGLESVETELARQMEAWRIASIISVSNLSEPIASGGTSQ